MPGSSLMADSAMANNPDDPLVPKFKYIKALSVGALEGKEEMKVELDSLIAQHPGNGREHPGTGDHRLYVCGIPGDQGGGRSPGGEEIYTSFDPDQEHYFLIALPAE